LELDDVEDDDDDELKPDGHDEIDFEDDVDDNDNDDGGGVDDFEDNDTDNVDENPNNITCPRCLLEGFSKEMFALHMR
jgi:hypothetical protein